MAIKTETFVADSIESYSAGGWTNASNAWDGNPSTFALYTADNGNFQSQYLSIAYSDMTSVTDIIYNVEVGLKVESDVGEGFLVAIPVLRSRYYLWENAVVFTPTIAGETIWKDVTKAIEGGILQTTWTRDELEDLRVIVYVVNPYVFTEIDMRLYEVYLKVTYDTVGRIPVSTSGRFAPYRAYTKDVVNGVLGVSTRGTFTMNGTSTPSGDAWYGYKTDGFFNQSIDAAWNQQYTDGTCVEGKYYLDITSGTGYIYDDTTAMNGIYQVLPPTKEFDVSIKIHDSDSLTALTNTVGFGLMIRTDDDNWMSVLGSRYALSYRYNFKIGFSSGSGGTYRLQYILYPYEFRIKCEMVDGNNYCTAYAKSDLGNWEEYWAQSLDIGTEKQIWIVAMHGPDAQYQYTASVDYFTGEGRTFNDRYAVRTLGVAQLSATTGEVIT